LKTVTLFSRVYGKKRKYLLDVVKSEVTSMIGELDVRLARFRTDQRGHLSMSFEGQDSERLDTVSMWILQLQVQRELMS